MRKPIFTQNFMKTWWILSDLIRACKNGKNTNFWLNLPIFLITNHSIFMKFCVQFCLQMIQNFLFWPNWFGEVHFTRFFKNQPKKKVILFSKCYQKFSRDRDWVNQLASTTIEASMQETSKSDSSSTARLGY